MSADMDDIEQREAAALLAAPVPVAVAGPVRMQALPSRSWSTKSRTQAVADGAVKVSSADPRRRCLTLVAEGGAVFVGPDQASCAAGVAAKWPAGLALVLTHSEDVWVSAAEDALVSVVEELWAE